MAASVMLQSKIDGAPCFRRGKTRDLYILGNGQLVIVATDRVSAFDRIMKNGIPGKGRILTALIMFWEGILKFRNLRNHCISQNVADIPDKRFHLPELEGRTLLCERATSVVPIECIVRGYLTGSAWSDYQNTGKVGGEKMPRGMREFQRFPEPIFTPSTKAEEGKHDQNITFKDVIGQFGDGWADTLRSFSLFLYNQAHTFALEKGIVLVDTKFEFGLNQDGNVMLVDEWLTPDSSRFCPSEEFEPGFTGKPTSLDKQVLRDWLKAMVERGEWDTNSPGIELPDEIVQETASRYRKIYKMLTGLEA